MSNSDTLANAVINTLNTMTNPLYWKNLAKDTDEIVADFDGIIGAGQTNVDVANIEDDSRSALAQVTHEAGVVMGAVGTLEALTEAFASNNEWAKAVAKAAPVTGFASLIVDLIKISEDAKTPEGVKVTTVLGAMSSAASLAAILVAGGGLMATLPLVAGGVALSALAITLDITGKDTSIVDLYKKHFPVIKFDADQLEAYFLGREAQDANYSDAPIISFEFVKRTEFVQSPLVLANDIYERITTTLLHESRVHFDLDAEGLKERTSWITPGSSFLVVDKNKNGVIDSGAEMFGNATVLKSGEKAANGFLALAEYDSNQDGVVDADDERASELRLWTDWNMNGKTDEGELTALDALTTPIQYSAEGRGRPDWSLELNYDNSGYQSAQGNIHKQQSSYLYHHGYNTTKYYDKDTYQYLYSVTNKTYGHGQLDDVWLATDQTHTTSTAIPLSDEVAQYPNIWGAGRVEALHYSMQKKPELLTLVKDFINNAKNQADFEILREQAAEILLNWAGEENTTGSRGYLSADIVNTVEKFSGKPFVQFGGINEGTSNPGPNAAREFNHTFNELSDLVFTELMGFVVYRPYLKVIRIDMNATNTWVVADVSQAIAMLKSQYDLSSAYGLDLLKGFYDQVSGLGLVSEPIIQAMRQAGDFNGDAFAQALAGFGFDSTVFGTVAADNLTGTTGDDQILADAGDDVLIGDEGDDVLVGGAGNDSIVANGGTDWIHAGAGSDLIRINSSNLTELLNSQTAATQHAIVNGGAGADYLLVDADQVVEFGSLANSVHHIEYLLAAGILDVGSIAAADVAKIASTGGLSADGWTGLNSNAHQLAIGHETSSDRLDWIYTASQWTIGQANDPTGQSHTVYSSIDGSAQVVVL